jgi:sRNA-binding protein
VIRFSLPVPGIDVRELTLALGYYTRNEHYQRALTKIGAERIDLDGKPVGPVDPEHAAAAREQLEKLAEKQAARRKLARTSGHVRSDLLSPQANKTIRANAEKALLPARLSLKDLRNAAAARKSAMA